MEILKHYIHGAFVEGDGAVLDVTNPSDGSVLAGVRLGGQSEVDAAVAAAKAAFPAWSNTSVSRRTAYLFRLHALMTEHEDELTQAVVLEGGKTLVDAQAEIKRAMQNLEVACGMPMLMQGETAESVAADIDAEVLRQPVGVFAIIPPYNFPAMVPFWFLPYAIAAGNTIVIKPSEQVPLTMQLVFRLMDKLGLPAGVVNLVNGDRQVSEALVAHPGVKGISFVGSSRVAKIVTGAASAEGKRVQALGSAKNHLLVMADASPDRVVDALITSCFGCAGQRCMATSVVAAVPEVYDALKEKLMAAMKTLRTGSALDNSTDVGPVISAASRDRILGLIGKGVEEGATLLIDGRHPAIAPELSGGFYVGPTLFSDVTPDMTIAREEIFGPVVCLMKISDLDAGLKLIEDCAFGNGASIFTNNGYLARTFQMKVNAGMVGINVGIPAPVAYFPFGGTKASMYGDIKAQGRDVVNFYTERKIITRRFFKD